MSQGRSGSYVEDPNTGKVTLVDRTQEPPPRTAPRQPGEPAHQEPPGAPPAADPAADKPAPKKAKE